MDMKNDSFQYVVDQFADLQILRYRVAGFDELSLEQKILVYYLSEAALEGRDILFDQNGKYNLRIRKLLEAVYAHFKGDRSTAEFKAFEVYMKRVWFSNGIHHHYACDKFVPGFSEGYFREIMAGIDSSLLPLKEGETVEGLCTELFPVIFNPSVMPKLVNQADGEDLVVTSAANYYEGVTQQEAEAFYADQKEKGSDNAQWFEDHSPVDARFKKEKVKGVSAKVITAAMLGGDLYPSTAIGINLPNSNWIRSVHGSKSVTIGNLTSAYNQAARGNGFREEFVYSKEELNLLDKYADVTDDLHTDLHECLGHGSGKLLPGVDPDALKAYGSTIEEARADLFGLYYLPDEKMVELKLTPDGEAYKAAYYSYMMNGLMTQLVRIEPGCNVEEAHMRNRQLIARWALRHGEVDGVVEMVKKDEKTFVRINDYAKLRNLFGQLLAEIQRIKSEGDFNAARALVEEYAVRVDPSLHAEVLERYSRLHLAPYKGFVNPVYTPVYDSNGHITNVTVAYTEGYTEQMLRYSKNYSNL